MNFKINAHILVLPSYIDFLGILNSGNFYWGAKATSCAISGCFDIKLFSSAKSVKLVI